MLAVDVLLFHLMLAALIRCNRDAGDSMHTPVAFSAAITITISVSRRQCVCVPFSCKQPVAIRVTLNRCVSFPHRICVSCGEQLPYHR